jgi:outer membrane protein OmpA-like peptidoglycan-associated protein
MNLLSTPLGALAVAAALAMIGAVSAQTPPQRPVSPLITDPLARTTDISIAQNYTGYQTQRDAMQALVSGGKSINSYDLSKSKCWLEVSFHEYTRNDRSAFAYDSLIESQRITQYLAGTAISAAPNAVNGSLGVATANPATQTLLVNGGQRLRSDLWSRADAYKALPDYGGAQMCGERQVACAEVQLAHAGNEINQQGWRHARPYIQLAEDGLDAAKKAIDACVPAPIVKVAPAVVTPPPTPAPVVKAPAIVEPKPVVLAPTPMTLSAEVLFNFDKRDMGNARDYTKQRLDTLIAQLKAPGVTVSKIALTGHADRSNLTGKADYNEKLSIDRANNVKAYMVAQGIAANLITTAYKSDSSQVEACTAKFKNQAQFEECLLPNRRVQVMVEGFKK